MLKISDRIVLRSSSGYSALLLGLCALGACDRGPVKWQDATRQMSMTPPVDGGTAPSDARLVLRPDGSTALEPFAVALTSPAAADTAACLASVRLASSGNELYGVWWSRRDGGRVALVASRSDDKGAKWTDIVAVDSTDRGTTSCTRPSPAITADSASGYVHVTYFLHGRNGPGVFFAHSMERGELFHEPVPIMYGERPAATAVAAADSMVVVAFENPNSQRPQISLAMSRTWGHIFARERPDASTGTSAEHPLAALRGFDLAVGWRNERTVTARVGRIK